MSLIHSALTKATGANRHNVDNLIITYRNAVETYGDRRLRPAGKREARVCFIRAEAALQVFVYPAARKSGE